jgi:hypothetical protein
MLLLILFEHIQHMNIIKMSYKYMEERFNSADKETFLSPSRKTFFYLLSEFMRNVLFIFFILDHSDPVIR